MINIIHELLKWTSLRSIVCLMVCFDINGIWCYDEDVVLINISITIPDTTMVLNYKQTQNKDSWFWTVRPIVPVFGCQRAVILVQVPCIIQYNSCGRLQIINHCSVLKHYILICWSLTSDWFILQLLGIPIIFVGYLKLFWMCLSIML